MEKTTHEDYPCGPCLDMLPLNCCNCGTIITRENMVSQRCVGECDICEYCGEEKCPECGDHVHCGGCI